MWLKSVIKFLRRQQDKSTQTMVDCTVKINYMTAAMLFMTAIMVVGMFLNNLIFCRMSVMDKHETLRKFKTGFDS